MQTLDNNEARPKFTGSYKKSVYMFDISVYGCAGVSTTSAWCLDWYCVTLCRCSMIASFD